MICSSERVAAHVFKTNRIASIIFFTHQPTYALIQRRKWSTPMPRKYRTSQYSNQLKGSQKTWCSTCVSIHHANNNHCVCLANKESTAPFHKVWGGPGIRVWQRPWHLVARQLILSSCNHSSFSNLALALVFWWVFLAFGVHIDWLAFSRNPSTTHASISLACPTTQTGEVSPSFRRPW